jgi:N-acetylmuramoyl-L-alanine amidase
MNIRTKLLTVSTFFILAVAGCQEPQRTTPKLALQEQSITIDELAARLGLRIEERDPAFVVMKDAANTVLIFTHTGGRYFINGKPVGPVGTVEKIGGTVRVPEALAGAIRSRLGTPERPAAAVRPGRTNALVVVDAGHGGKDPGTMVGGVDEKHIVLSVARKVAALLEQQGVTVVMTRQDDRFIELEDRADIANQRDTDLFVSIHADSAPDRSVSGYTIYTAPDASRQAYGTAQSMSAAMAKTGMDTRGIREAEYKVLVLTRCPAVLVELGYLSNAGDARRLQDPAFQNRLAQAITDGILNSLQ